MSLILSRALQRTRRNTHFRNRRPPELVVPANRTVHVRLASADVIHNFYIPRTLFKGYAIPGTTNEFDLTFTELGRYDGNAPSSAALAIPTWCFPCGW